MSANAINYPQGFTSLMGEFFPMNGDFFETLLLPLLDGGAFVNIGPIVYDQGSHFLSDSGVVDDTNVKVKLLEAVPHRALVDLAHFQRGWLSNPESEGAPGRVIDHFINALWIQNSENGELSLDELVRRAMRNLGLRFPALHGELLSANL